MTVSSDPALAASWSRATVAAGANRRRRNLQIYHHGVLIFGVLLMMAPLLVAFASSTYDPIVIHSQGLQLGYGGEFASTYGSVLFDRGGFTGDITGVRMLWNSVILGLAFAVGKIVISMMAAYAIVYFRIPFGAVAFWIIFSTVLLPLEVRILPSYEVVQSMGMLNTWSGLILPLIASATATFYFRQFFKSVPDELLEAARIDGAGPVRFFLDILVPLSKTMMAAIFIIMFVVGWNQYLWPALMTTDESLFTIVRGIRQILQVWIGANIPEYNKALAMAILAMLPPALIVLIFQRAFVKGLVESEK
ncbi:MAG: sn-glycerol-3-phosphate ABC transporter permease UgpE [Albimonas sp.]|uniref:sn-glycerol-3-phosphate ABC transporter permease UgpE n=1 Tax=Albimonas sp. TaxID=1872425 RepID=UPI004057A937